MATPLLALNRFRLFVLLTCLCPCSLFSQETFEVGLSYRYVYFEEARFALSSTRAEALQPHELDANFRFDIGDRKIRGTLTIGYARYGYSAVTFPNLLFLDCEEESYSGTVQNYHAYRFNPGIEYQIRKSKLSYGVGVGIFYYGAFGGQEEKVQAVIYQHRDSISGDCIEDSSFALVSENRAAARPIALLGLSTHMYIGYEAVEGLTFFAQFSVNPTVSTSERFFSLSPNGSAGVYFRFRSRKPDAP